MKKALTFFLVIAMCISAVFMTACSKDGKNESSEISEESKGPTTMKLKVGSYNIANGREIYWDFKVLAKDITDNGLDIVGIQEVDQFCNRSKNSDTLALLKEYTGMEYGAFFKCIDYDGGEYGTAILSKYPILGTEELELNDGSLVERRLLTYAKIDVDGTVINFFNTHLTIHSDPIRALEFQLVKDRVKDEANCILVGDFNVDSYDEWEILKPLSYINNPETGYITHPEGDRQIDNICYSSEFRLVEGGHGIYQQYHSDHVLLYAEFEFDKTE